ncbi:hypothetical protein COI49_15870 [Bacillus toyonensis]|uniref:hypothetical protein n=1 Tax=Bacillus toyonensis TaxID=155322 RepID=UPI000BFDBC2E|nr:hypothetical protein [Bacillus toyonensis]PHG02592.1 hypothetical protein COI49_15870 [Bacillus toyonensis]
MTKLLNTKDIDNLYKSLADILDVRLEIIKHYILMNYHSIRTTTSVEDINLESLFSLLLEHNGKKGIEEIEISEIAITHLSTRECIETAKNESIYNLEAALLNKTSLSMFFEDLGVNFYIADKRIMVEYKNKVINWSDFDNDDNKRPTALLLQRRLEGNKFFPTGDKCVNGFLFNSKVHQNSNVRHIGYVPEVVQNVLDVLDLSEATKKWIEKNKACILVFRVKFDDVVFDRFEKLSVEKKKKLLLQYCIYFLSRNYISSDWSEEDNPIMRLMDYTIVPKENIIDAYFL